MKDSDLNRTLEVILKLIDNDVKAIASNFTDTQLDSHSAQTLCRYASTLSGIKEDKQKEKVKEKQELSKYTTEELMQMHRKMSETKNV